MRKLLLTAAIASLIAVPSAFAHGKSTSHHGRTHSSSRHSSHRTHRHGDAVDGVASTDQANLSSRSPRSSGRHPDEEEVEIDELASKAN